MERDYFVDEVLKDYRSHIVEPVSTGRRSSAFPDVHQRHDRQAQGLPTSHRRLPRLRDRHLQVLPGHSSDDVYWCMADIGWITGHSYIVYGPLALAATSVLYEGVPQFPDAGRPWRIAERLDVNIFHTSPTAIRMLRKAGGDEPKKYNYHFKHMTTVGEPIEPEVWRWYHEVVGKGEAVIVDTWWQTETGGFLCTTKPALDPMKPGSAGPPALGIYPVIWDEERQGSHRRFGNAGKHLHSQSLAGNHADHLGRSATLRQPILQKIQQSIRKAKTGATGHTMPPMVRYCPLTATYRILGRVDDVINVAGHRLGTKELESACLTMPEIAEAAVVPAVDEVKGRVPEVYVSLKPGVLAEQSKCRTKSSPRSKP